MQWKLQICLQGASGNDNFFLMCQGEQKGVMLRSVRPRNAVILLCLVTAFVGVVVYTQVTLQSPSSDKTHINTKKPYKGPYCMTMEQLHEYALCEYSLMKGVHGPIYTITKQTLQVEL